VDRSRGRGTHAVKVEGRTGDSDPDFDLDDWTMEIDILN
jgi:hypothetical protein